MKRLFLLSPFVLVGLFCAYLWLSLNWTYATGERAGYIQKFSRKGWLCKTWEGELSLVTLPGAAPEKFFFSVKDDDVAAQVNTLMGKRVTLTYDQHPGVPSSCFGETAYFVRAIRVVN